MCETKPFDYIDESQVGDNLGQDKATTVKKKRRRPPEPWFHAILRRRIAVRSLPLAAKMRFRAT